VTALNASSQEARNVWSGFFQSAWGWRPQRQSRAGELLCRILVAITNLSPPAPLPLNEFILNRAVTGVEPLAATQT